MHQHRRRDVMIFDGGTTTLAVVSTLAVLLATVCGGVSGQGGIAPERRHQAPFEAPGAARARLLSDPPRRYARPADADQRPRQIVNSHRAPQPWSPEAATSPGGPAPSHWVPPVQLLSQLADPRSGRLPTLRFAAPLGHQWASQQPLVSHGLTPAYPSVHDLPLEPTEFSPYLAAAPTGPTGPTGPAAPPPAALGYLHTALATTTLGDRTRPAKTPGDRTQPADTLGDRTRPTDTLGDRTQPGPDTDYDMQAGPETAEASRRDSAAQVVDTLHSHKLQLGFDGRPKETPQTVPEDKSAHQPDGDPRYYENDDDEYYYYDYDYDYGDGESAADPGVQPGANVAYKATEQPETKAGADTTAAPESDDEASATDEASDPQTAADTNNSTTNGASGEDLTPPSSSPSPSAAADNTDRDSGETAVEPTTPEPAEPVTTATPSATGHPPTTSHGEITTAASRAPASTSISVAPHFGGNGTLGNDMSGTPNDATTAKIQLLLFPNFPQFGDEVTKDPGHGPQTAQPVAASAAPPATTETSVEQVAGKNNSENGESSAAPHPTSTAKPVVISRRPIPRLETRPSFSKTFRFGKGADSAVTQPHGEGTTARPRARPRPGGTPSVTTERPLSLTEVRAAIQPFSLAELLVESGQSLSQFLRSRPRLDTVLAVIRQLRARREGRQPPTETRPEAVAEPTAAAATVGSRMAATTAATTTATETQTAATTDTEATTTTGPEAAAAPRTTTDGAETTAAPTAAGGRVRPAALRPQPADIAAIMHAMKRHPPVSTTRRPAPSAATFSWQSAERRLPSGLAVVGGHGMPSTRRPPTAATAAPTSPRPTAGRSAPTRRRTWSLAEILAEKKLSLPAFLKQGGNVKRLLLQYNGASDDRRASPTERKDGDDDDDEVATTPAPGTASEDGADRPASGTEHTKVYSLAEILVIRDQTLKQFIIGGGNVRAVLEKYNGVDWRRRKATTASPAVGGSSASPAPDAAHPPTDGPPAATSRRPAGVVLPTRPSRPPASLRPLFGEGGSYAAGSQLGLRLDGGDPPVYGRPLLRTRTGGGRAPPRPATYWPSVAADRTSQPYVYRGERFDTPATSSLPPDDLFERVNQETEPAWPADEAGSAGRPEPVDDDSSAVRDAVVTGGVVGGCALLFFVGLLLFCRWRQWRDVTALRPGLTVGSDRSSSPLDTANIDLANYAKAYKRKSAGFWGSLRKSLNGRYAAAYSEDPYGGVVCST